MSRKFNPEAVSRCRTISVRGQCNNPPFDKTELMWNRRTSRTHPSVTTSGFFRRTVGIMELVADRMSGRRPTNPHVQRLFWLPINCILNLPRYLQLRDSVLYISRVILLGVILFFSAGSLKCWPERGFQRPISKRITYYRRQRSLIRSFFQLSFACTGETCCDLD